MERKAEGGKKKGVEVENTSRYRQDSFETASSLLGYHSLIAVVARDAEWPGK